jgi:hypothetical protein
METMQLTIMENRILFRFEKDKNHGDARENATPVRMITRIVPHCRRKRTHQISFRETLCAAAGATAVVELA